MTTFGASIYINPIENTAKIAPHMGSGVGASDATTLNHANLIADFSRYGDGSLLPPGVRWIGRRNDAIIVVFEQPAGKRLIRWRPTRSMPTSSYQASMPWTVLIMAFTRAWDAHRRPQFAGMRAYSRPGPITSLDDKLFFSFLPNVAAPHGDICMGSYNPMVPRLGAGIADAVNHFWNRRGNNEIGQVVPCDVYLPEYEKRTVVDACNELAALEEFWNSETATSTDMAELRKQLKKQSGATSYAFPAANDGSYWHFVNNPTPAVFRERGWTLGKAIDAMLKYYAGQASRHPSAWLEQLVHNRQV